MSSKAKQLAMDVYRDLRDRRLLLVVVALVVGIIAVPLLVKGTDRGPDPITAATPDVAAGAQALDAVVLSDEPALRDYRVRLDGEKGSNPFKQQLATPLQSTSADGGGGGAGNLPTEETATSSSSQPEAPASPVEPAEDEGLDDAPSEDVDEGDSGSPADAGASKVVTFTVDVKVGPRGDARVLRDVEVGTLLPSKRRAVAQYLGSDLDGDEASFALARDVIAVEGDGTCSPKRSRCDFLRLSVGEEEQLELESSGTTVRVKLLAMTREERPLPAAAKDLDE